MFALWKAAQLTVYGKGCTLTVQLTGLKMRKWYAVCDEGCSYSKGSERDEAEIWTVSADPEAPGWSTDSGSPGYGLTRADAEFIVAAANEAEKRSVRREFGFRIGRFFRAQIFIR
jgi:hypothetical protein